MGDRPLSALGKTAERLNVYTYNWAPHIAIFGSFAVVIAGSAHRFGIAKRRDIWQPIVFGVGVLAPFSYVKTETYRFIKHISQDPELEQIDNLGHRARHLFWLPVVPISLSSRYWQRVAATKNYGDKDNRIGVVEKIALFSSRMFLSSATRNGYAEELLPELKAGTLSPHDYDLCVTLLSAHTEIYTDWVDFCAVAFSTIVLDNIVPLFTKAKLRLLKTAFTIALGIGNVGPHVNIYNTSKIVTQFRDRGSVIKALERVA